MREDKRPSPKELLEQLQAEEERIQKKEFGRLKIFLGFAAGTGKTYAMLEAAQDLKRQGVDVVAGYVEPHRRAETAAMEQGLEKLPFLMVDYKGIKVREFDLDGALKRRPKVLLVDELAHTNAPGCRHRKRYQDVKELLEHGINVYTTVNIQHLESLNDIVGSITGIQVRERIPDSVFDEADQVKLVDIEAEELITRMKEGKIYSQVQAARALENFFTRDKLIALREIALRRMADRVNHLAETERKRMGSGEFSAGEHVLTCISPSPTNTKVIRAAARLAYAFHGEFTALYVENRKLQNMDEHAKKRRDENMRLAKTLGAKVAVVYGEDVAQQIAEYAKVSNVTKLVIGKTNHRIYFGQTKKAMVDAISLYAPSLDVYIIPDLQSERAAGKFHPPGRGKRDGRLRAADFVKMLALLCLGAAVCLQSERLGRPELKLLMAFLLGAALASVVARGYIRRNRELNAKRAYRTEILLSNSRKLRRVSSREEVSNELASQIQKMMNFTVIVYLKSNGQMREPRVYLRKGLDEGRLDGLSLGYTSQTERAVVSWVFKNGHRAGCTTHTLPDAQAIYLPVMDKEHVTAVVGLVLEERREIGSFEYDVISAILGEAALVLERIDKIEALQEALR